MRQAGDGADYMEGWEGNAGGGGGRSRQGSCFKCGQWGHWAANCPAALPEQPPEPVSVSLPAGMTGIPGQLRDECLTAYLFIFLFAPFCDHIFSTTAFILAANEGPQHTGSICSGVMRFLQARVDPGPA